MDGALRYGHGIETAEQGRKEVIVISCREPLYVPVYQGDWEGLSVSISREHREDNKGEEEERGMMVGR